MEKKSKIISGLNRISEVFKVLLWEYAKKLKLSPVQIQILLFVSTHKAELCTVSYIAKEFNVSKSSLSQGIKVLIDKKILIKDHSSEDSRSYIVQLSMKGQEIVRETENFTLPIKKGLDQIPEGDLDNFFSTLSKLVYHLNQTGILTVQRTCFACSYYQKKNENHYCNLLEVDLKDSDIEIDCPDFKVES